MRQPKAVLLVFLVSLFNCVPGFAKEQAAQLLAKLPRNFQGYIGDEIRFFDDSRLGAAKNYISAAGGNVTIYLFDLGVSQIPDGAQSEVVKRALNLAEYEVDQFARLGYYKDLRVLSKQSKTFKSQRTPALEFLSFSYTAVKSDPQSGVLTEVESHLYVSGFRQHVIKIRITQPFSPTGAPLNAQNLIEPLISILRS